MLRARCGRDARGPRGDNYGETNGELLGDEEGDGLITSSNRVMAAGLSLSDFRATPARPSAASLLTVAFCGEGATLALVIAASNARRASSGFPASREARP